jgi:hypothetical protein
MAADSPAAEHPLDIDLYDMAVHLRTCEQCRERFARVLYAHDLNIQLGKSNAGE